MKISAVICELNPFHRGHKYLIDNIRKNVATHIVGIMSSNFTQRGEPAIVSKQIRTLMALHEGIDLVIEIPTIWAISTAEKYAFAGVHIADSLGCIDNLCFSSEVGDIIPLKLVSDTLKTDIFSKYLRKYLDIGIAFAKARELSIKDILGERYSLLLRYSNNVLGIEYLKALAQLDSTIRPYTIKRVGVDHHSSMAYNQFASSSYIRELIYKKQYNFSDYMSMTSYDMLINEIKFLRAPADIHYIERSILSKLRSVSKKDIINICDVNEGLENRICKASTKATNMNQLLCNLKTKRYTESRLKRLIMCIFLDIKKSHTRLPITYVHILGANFRGREILKKIRRKSKLSLITKYSQLRNLDIISKIVFSKECMCTDIYNMMLPSPLPCGQEQKNSVIMI